MTASVSSMNNVRLLVLDGLVYEWRNGRWELPAVKTDADHLSELITLAASPIFCPQCRQRVKRSFPRRPKVFHCPDHPTYRITQREYRAEHRRLTAAGIHLE